MGKGQEKAEGGQARLTVMRSGWGSPTDDDDDDDDDYCI